jgi:FixJ family two-component response regulator
VNTEQRQHSPIVSLVDDDCGFCEALADLFESAGYQIHTFSSAADFLISGAAQRSDVLITDIQLEGIDGLTLMDLVAHIPGLPIIVITARPEEEFRIRATSKGCAAFLRKPFDPGLLLGHVAAALR